MRSATSPPWRRNVRDVALESACIDQPDHFVSRIFLYFPTSIVAELNEICEILGYTPEQLVIKPD